MDDDGVGAHGPPMMRSVDMHMYIKTVRFYRGLVDLVLGSKLCRSTLSVLDLRSLRRISCPQTSNDGHAEIVDGGMVRWMEWAGIRLWLRIRIEIMIRREMTCPVLGCSNLGAGRVLFV